MKLTISPTRRIDTVNGQPARVWEGVDEHGIKVLLWSYTVQPQSDDPAVMKIYETELRGVDGTRQLTSFDIRLAL